MQKPLIITIHLPNRIYVHDIVLYMCTDSTVKYKESTSASAVEYSLHLSSLNWCRDNNIWQELNWTFEVIAQ